MVFWSTVCQTFVYFEQEGAQFVKKIGGVFAFKVKDGPNGQEATWFVDVKNGNGCVHNDTGENISCLESNIGGFCWIDWQRWPPVTCRYVNILLWMEMRFGVRGLHTLLLSCRYTLMSGAPDKQFRFWQQLNRLPFFCWLLKEVISIWQVAGY